MSAGDQRGLESEATERAIDRAFGQGRGAGLEGERSDVAASGKGASMTGASMTGSSMAGSSMAGASGSEAGGSEAGGSGSGRAADLDGFVDPRELEEVSELEGLKALCADALRQGQPLGSELQARRVVRRVLSRTTREDLRRRGDLGVLLEFCADRLRDSVLLRVAVAALVVQVTIVPIVAWHLLAEPGPGGVRFTLDPAPEVALDEEFPAEEEPLVVVGGSNWWDLDDAEAWLQADADFEGARARLGQVKAALEADVPAPSTPTGAALLRFTGLDSAATDQGSEGLEGIETLIVSILRAEWLLDEVQQGGAWSGLEDALEQVGETLVVAKAAVDSAPPGPLALLASRTLRRAFELGLAAPAPDARLPQLRADDWLRMIAEEALGVAPGDAFVRRWNQVVQEL